MELTISVHSSRIIFIQLVFFNMTEKIKPNDFKTIDFSQ